MTLAWSDMKVYWALHFSRPANAIPGFLLLLPPESRFNIWITDSTTCTSNYRELTNRNTKALAERRTRPPLQCIRVDTMSRIHADEGRTVKPDKAENTGKTDDGHRNVGGSILCSSGATGASPQTPAPTPHSSLPRHPSPPTLPCPPIPLQLYVECSDMLVTL